MSKRIPLSQYKKKPSVLKQVTTLSERVVDEEGNVFQATGTATPGTKGTGAILTQAKGGEQFTGPDADYFKKISSMGATGKELAEKGYIHSSKIGDYDKMYPISKGKPGTSDVKYKPVMKETKGDQVDVYSSYEMRQQNRALKSSARQVGKAEKKLKRMEERGLKDTERYKAQEAVLKGAKKGLAAIEQQADLRKNRALSQTYQYRDPSKGLSEGGEVQLKNTSGDLKTKSDFEAEVKAKSNAIESDAGNSTSTESTNKILSSNDKPKPQTTNFSTTASNAMSKGFSTTPLAKKSGAVSMLKKKGCKMGGFGSKTYK